MFLVGDEKSDPLRMFWDGKDHVAIVHYWAIKPSDALDCWIKKRSLKKCPETWILLSIFCCYPLVVQHSYCGY